MSPLSRTCVHIYSIKVKHLMWKVCEALPARLQTLTWTKAGTFWLLVRSFFYLNGHGFVFLFFSLSPNEKLPWFSGSLMMTCLAARRRFIVNYRKISFIIVRRGDTIFLISCLPGFHSDPNYIIHGSRFRSLFQIAFFFTLFYNTLSHTHLRIKRQIDHANPKARKHSPFTE